MKLLLLFAIACSFLASSSGEEQIQQEFEKMDEKLWPFRDACLKENNMALSDLKDYENENDIPERDLCFFKCFYTQMGFLDDKGVVNIDGIELRVDILGVDKDKVKELTECTKGIGDITTCNDVKKLDKCIEKAL